MGEVGFSRGATVVVDEIQRLPSLLNEVHRFIEDHGLRFVLLGSSARKLKQAGTNLLAGRAAHRQMFPLLPQELGDDFDLAEVLRHGSLPVAAVFHGQVLSVAGLARDAGVARTTVDGYLGILADTHLAWLLPAFEARLRVKERRHPKLYWTDSGIVRGVRREFHPPTSAERGSLFEGWIGQLLRAYGEPASGSGHPFDGLWYWAPAEGQIEVDFLIKSGKRLVALEAKAKATLASKDFSGLRALRGLPGLERRLVVYLGDRPQRTEDGIDVLPLQSFLAAIEQHGIW